MAKKISSKVGGEVIASHTSEVHEIEILAVLDRCEAASKHAGYDLFHVVVEFWDIRNPERPYFITFVIPPRDGDGSGDNEESHYTRAQGVEACYDILNVFGREADTIPGEPGDYIKALMQQHIEREMQHNLLHSLGSLLSALSDGDADDDDGDDAPLPGVFAGFNPFGS